MSDDDAQYRWWKNRVREITEERNMAGRKKAKKEEEKEQVDPNQLVLDLVKSLETDEKGAPYDEVLGRAERVMTRETFEEAATTLLDGGHLVEPQLGELRLGDVEYTGPNPAADIEVKELAEAEVEKLSVAIELPEPVLNVEGKPFRVAPYEVVPQEHIDELRGKKPPKELVDEAETGSGSWTATSATVSFEGSDAKLGKGGGESKQLDLEGNEARYPIKHEVKVTVTHKYESATAHLSVSEKALEKWLEDDKEVLGLVKTKLRVSPSVEGSQWEALCEEFATRVEEEML